MYDSLGNLSVSLSTYSFIFYSTDVLFLVTEWITFNKQPLSDNTVKFNLHRADSWRLMANHVVFIYSHAMTLLHSCCCPNSHNNSKYSGLIIHQLRAPATKVGQRRQTTACEIKPTASFFPFVLVSGYHERLACQLRHYGFDFLRPNKS